jgi:hypothetical protein
MTDIEELVRSFRSDQRGPAEGAVERAYAHSVRRPRVAVWRRPLALVPAVGAVAAAVVAAILLWPSETVSPLERAAAAVAPSGKIVYFRFEIRSEQRDPSGTWTGTELITMHDWALFEDGNLVRARRFISDGPLSEPPTDEDTSVVAEDGALVLTSWVDGSIRRERVTDELTVSRLSVAGYLRSLYTSGKLEEVRRDDEGIHLGASAEGCREETVSEVVVHAESFLPRRMVEVAACGPDGQPTSRQVLTFTETETFADTEANRLLLDVGDWPIRRQDEVPQPRG